MLRLKLERIQRSIVNNEYVCHVFKSTYVFPLSEFSDTVDASSFQMPKSN